MKVGDMAPDFSLQAHNGTQVRLSDFRGKKNVVVFFYPKDDTPGWTLEVCGFRDRYIDFQNNDTEVFGVSADTKDSHTSFVQKHSLPYLLLIDESKTLRSLWRVPKSMFILDGRVSYVIDKQGVCRFIYNSSTKPVAHIQACFRAVQKL